MQKTILTFPTVTAPSAPTRVIKIMQGLHASRVFVTPEVEKRVRFDSFVSPYDYNAVMASSTARMEAVYERVTAFLQKMRDEELV